MTPDEEALYELDMEFWLKMPPLVTDPEPTPDPRWQGLVDGTRRANAQVQAPIVVDDERYIGVSEASQRTGFSAAWIRTSAKDGNLAERGVRFVVKPRFPGDQRSPVYLAESDLSKLVHRPRGRFKKGAARGT